MTSYAWVGVLKQFEPNYDALKYHTENGPRVIANLRKSTLGWIVKIEEDWNDPILGSLYYTEDYKNLDHRCIWTEDQLKNWKFVIRLSYQEWKFFNRGQAEKFITLFNLKWDQ